MTEKKKKSPSRVAELEKSRPRDLGNEIANQAEAKEKGE